MGMPAWKGFTIHHSLTKDGRGVSWGAIRRYHTETKVWAAVGYHYGIEYVSDAYGSAYEVFTGRPLNWIGAHARGQNKTHIGVCFMGNFDAGKPNKEMLVKAVTHILVPLTLGLHINQRQGLGEKDLGRLLVMHRSVAPWKSCPGEKFPMEELRTMFTDMLREELV